MDTRTDGQGGAKRAVDLETLTNLACELGATAAVVLSGSDVSVNNHLAKICHEPGCPDYGLSRSCPPHHGGPEEFRMLLSYCEELVFFKIEVPAAMLLSGDRQEIMAVIHEVASGVERAAMAAGYARARGFAGGSCKQLFCGNHLACRVIGEGGACRHPDLARPSMSGFGIDVGKLMKAAGWRMWSSAKDAGPDAESMGALCGLVLLG
jgi:predicted metal-binding protein